MPSWGDGDDERVHGMAGNISYERSGGGGGEEPVKRHRRVSEAIPTLRAHRTKSGVVRRPRETEPAEGEERSQREGQFIVNGA